MTQPSGPGGGLPEQSRVVLVTGASAGIGFHTAREIAARGASVLITGRDRRRGEDAVRAIATVANPAFQDQVVRTARDLARDAATAAGHRGRP